MYPAMKFLLNLTLAFIRKPMHTTRSATEAARRTANAHRGREERLRTIVHHSLISCDKEKVSLVNVGDESTVKNKNGGETTSFS